jgi:hypothetical protein
MGGRRNQARCPAAEIRQYPRAGARHARRCASCSLPRLLPAGCRDCFLRKPPRWKVLRNGNASDPPKTVQFRNEEASSFLRNAITSRLDFGELTFKWPLGKDAPTLRQIAAASITTGWPQSTTTMVRNSRVYTSTTIRRSDSLCDRRNHRWWPEPG